MVRRAPRLTKRQRKTARAQDLGRVVDRLTEEASRRGLTVRRGAAPGLPKMSDVLCEYVRPLFETMPSPPDATTHEALLLLAALCWNAACAEADDPARVATIVATWMETLGFPEEEAAAEVRALIERKRALFADDPRQVAGVRVRQEGNARHIDVASARYE